MGDGELDEDAEDEQELEQAERLRERLSKNLRFDTIANITQGLNSRDDKHQKGRGEAKDGETLSLPRTASRKRMTPASFMDVKSLQR